MIIEPAISRINRDQIMIVEGYAKKSINPDIAYINISAVFTGTNAGELKKEADKALTQTVNDLLSLSSSMIPQENIKTNYSVSPKYDKESNIIGYIVNPTLIVKTADFTAVDKVIEIAENNKLNLVNSVYFTLDDPVTAKGQLREEAIEAAKTKAEKLIQSTGIRLGNIINISENNYSPYTSNRNDMLLVNSTTGSSADAPVEESGSSTGTFNPGQTEISMTVYLTYAVY
jgi:uncharacterized protein YggE